MSKKVISFIVFIWPVLALHERARDLISFALEPMFWIIGVIFFLNYIHQKNTLPESETMSQKFDNLVAKSMTNLRSLLILTLIYQFISATIILAHRFSFEFIISWSSSISNLIAPLVPALSNIPNEMKVERFYSRIEVTQEAATFGYIYAIAVIIWWVCNRHLIIKGIGKRPRAGLGIFMRISGIIAGAACIWLVFYSIGISTDSERRGMFQEFETSDVDLFYRMWVEPALILQAGFAIILAGIFLESGKQVDVGKIDPNP